jgi:hypothetical protein
VSGILQTSDRLAPYYAVRNSFHPKMPPTQLWMVCPQCLQRSGVPLALNRLNDTDYFECADCGHVWKQALRTADPKPQLPRKR